MSQVIPPIVASAHCNACGRLTKHDVLHEEVQNSADHSDRYSVYGRDTFRLLRCRGCEAISVEHESSNSEVTDADGSELLTKEYFPPRTFRPVPKWVDAFEIPGPVETLLRETYVAFQNGARSLAAMGVRAALEAVMIDSVGDNGSFAANLQLFSNAGHVSAKHRDLLLSTLEIGHATIHRGYAPDDRALIACLEVTEHVVQGVYILPGVSTALTSGVPPRSKE